MLINNGYENQLITLKNIKNAVGSSISDSNQVITHNISDTTAAMQSNDYIAVFNTERPKTSDYTNRTVRNKELNVISKYIDVPEDGDLHEICIGYILRHMQSYNISPNPVTSGTYGTYAYGSGNYTLTFDFGNSFDSSCAVQDNVQWANSSGSGTKIRTEYNSSLNDSYGYWGYKYYPPYFEYSNHNDGSNVHESYATFTIDLCGLLNKEIEMYVVFAAPSSITYTDQTTWSHTTNNTDLKDLKLDAIYNALRSNESNGFSLQTLLLLNIFNSTFFNTRFTSVLTRTLTFDESYTLYTPGWYKNVNINGIHSVTHKYYIRKLKFVPRLYWCNGSPFYEAMTLLYKSSRSEYLEDSYQNCYVNPSWDSNYSYNTIVDGTMDTSLIYNNYGAEYVGQGIYKLGGAEGKIFAGLRDNRKLYSTGVFNYLYLMLGNPGLLRADYSGGNWYQSDDTYDLDLGNFITNIDDYNYFTYYVGVDVGTNGSRQLNTYMNNNKKYLWNFEYEDFISRYSVSNSNLRIRRGNAYMNSIKALGRYVWMMPVFTCYYKKTNNNIYYDYPTYPQNQTYYGLLSKKTDYDIIYPVNGLIKDTEPHFYNIDFISGGYGYGYGGGGTSNYNKLHISC